MKFLADENLEYAVFSYLIENKIDILAVRDLMKGSTDAEIIEYAFKNNRVIITNDKDFGELTFRLHKSHTGIILLRLSDANSDEKKKLVLSALEKLGRQIANKFIVVEKSGIRIRSLI
jgi:predicted nuclease of predicted toxin-antitoxin system